MAHLRHTAVLQYVHNPFHTAVLLYLGGLGMVNPNSEPHGLFRDELRNQGGGGQVKSGPEVRQ